MLYRHDNDGSFSRVVVFEITVCRCCVKTASIRALDDEFNEPTRRLDAWEPVTGGAIIIALNREVNEIKED